MARKTPQAHIDNCINEYASGKSATQISCETGISQSVIGRAIKRAGLPVHPKITVDDAAIVQMYVSGMSENAVAKHFGIDRGSVRPRLLKAGVQPRGRSEAELLKWSGMTGDARKGQVAAANAAMKGRKMPLQSIMKGARTRMQRQINTSDGEKLFATMLAARGIDAVIQEAIGPYNCDLGAFPVAVEIWGGHWHFHGRHLARTPERFRYLLNAGWHVLCIVNSKGRGGTPLTDATADYVAAYIEHARRNPAARREYRVIRGAGEMLATGSADDDDISLEWAFTNRRNALGQYESVARKTLGV